MTKFVAASRGGGRVALRNVSLACSIHPRDAIAVPSGESPTCRHARPLHH
jgi:hypothetical protein